MASHEEYMLRTVQLAYKAFGQTRTNPMVGAVIVYNDKIIGEGYHTAFGKPHAEIEAFESVQKENKKLIPKSSMYVTLEPCAHYGKTPPCSLRIIEEGIQRIYIGCTDPFDQVDGKGIQLLKDAGITVQTGIAEKTCKKLLHRFQTHLRYQRPFIHLKWAQSSDGYLGRPNESTEITAPSTAFWTHKLRSQNDAILVGTNTLLTDNPALDNRLFPASTPIKIILDRKDQIQHRNYRFFQSEGKTLGVLSEGSAYYHLYDDHIFIPENLSDLDQLKFILDSCYKKHIGAIFVEGGRQLLNLFIQNSLWDQADILRSGSKVLNDGIKAPHLTGNCVLRKNLGPDECLRIYPLSINVKDYLKPG